MSEEKTQARMTSFVNTAESKIGHMVGQLAQPEKEWLTPEEAVRLRDRLVRLQELIGQAQRMIAPHVPVAE